MNVAVPANRVFQPLLLRKTQRGFNLRADVGLADSAIEVRHEDDRGNLFHQGAISGFEIGELRIFRPLLVRPLRWIYDAPGAGWVADDEHSRQVLENFFGLRRVQLRVGDHSGMECGADTLVRRL